MPEGDVTAFVEEMISGHKEADERLEHLDSLHRLATETLQEAQELAERHKSEGRKQADDEAQTTIGAATERTRLIVQTAEKLASDLKQDAKTESERQIASAILAAEAKANELIVSAQASAERRLNDAQHRAATPPGADDPQPAGPAGGQVQAMPAPSSDQKTRHTFRWNAVPGATR